MMEDCVGFAGDEDDHTLQYSVVSGAAAADSCTLHQLQLLSPLPWFVRN
jgi:hypothetical protein